ncbi:HU family DNA-binding protein [Neisseriaceae bacterium TC5R-5]|nr:HU family DNA-binding protein [Neisseriaceae bacterium TC5R-5]
MTKQELIKQLATNAEITNKQAEAVLNTLTTAIQDTLRAGGELLIPDIGKFGTAQKAARAGRNPQTGETIQIAAKRVPKFTPVKALKDAAL